MLSLAIEFDDLDRALAELPKALERQRPQLLASIGRVTRGHVHADFLVKSRGGRGQDGIQWKPLAPATVRRKQRLRQPLIGVGTGQLGALGNIAAEVQGDSVAIRFLDQPNAAQFDELRPLLPERLPQPWYRELDDLVQASLDQLAENHFSGMAT